MKNGNTCWSRRSNMLHTHFHIAKAVAHLKSNYYSAVKCDDQLHNLLKRWIYCERLLHFDFQLISARKSLGSLNLSYSTQLNIITSDHMPLYRLTYHTKNEELLLQLWYLFIYLIHFKVHAVKQDYTLAHKEIEKSNHFYTECAWRYLTYGIAVSIE